MRGREAEHATRRGGGGAACCDDDIPLSHKVQMARPADGPIQSSTGLSNTPRRPGAERGGAPRARMVMQSNAHLWPSHPPRGGCAVESKHLVILELNARAWRRAGREARGEGWRAVGPRRARPTTAADTFAPPPSPAALQVRGRLRPPLSRRWCPPLRDSLSFSLSLARALSPRVPLGRGRGSERSVWTAGEENSIDKHMSDEPKPMRHTIHV